MFPTEHIFSTILTEADSSPQEPASAILWTYFYLAQHYDYMKDARKAFQYIDMAIEHTPTLIELFVAKGRLYKVNENAFSLFRC